MISPQHIWIFVCSAWITLEVARRLQGRPYQIILRELQTLAGHSTRLHQ